MKNKNRIHDAFFTLLRSGLWSRPIDRAGCFPLSGVEWQQVYDLSKEQTVEGIVFSAVEKLRKELLPPTAIWLNWLVRVTKIEQHNILMNKCLAEQVKSFKILDVEPVLLKGQGLAKYYDEPLRRVSGDIDWYFSTTEKYKIANDWAKKNGNDIQYEAGRSMCYTYKGIEIDHHAHIIDLYSPFARSVLKKIIHEQEGLNNVLDVENEQCRLLSPIVNIIQVVSHVLKHLLAFGIGVRQLCDVAKVYEAEFKKIDGNYLKKNYERLGIARWIALLHDVLVRYIGLKESSLPYKSAIKVKADWMMADVLRAGNFGFNEDVDRSNDRYNQHKRRNSVLRVSGNLWKYGKYAPMEALFFPLHQLYTGIVKK